MSSLGDFVEFAGWELTGALCRCFVQADRINSLAVMLHCARATYAEKSIPYVRDSMTFTYFMMGTLWEYSNALAQLKEAEKRRSIYDRKAWTRLDRWRRIGASPVHETIRNEAAFHLDRNLVRKGLGRLLKSGVRPYPLIAGDDRKQRNSFGKLGQDALLRGLDARTRGQLAGVVRGLGKFIGVHQDLDPELLRILDALDLTPLYVKMAGANS